MSSFLCFFLFLCYLLVFAPGGFFFVKKEEVGVSFFCEKGGEGGKVGEGRDCGEGRGGEGLWGGEVREGLWGGEGAGDPPLHCGKG